MSEAALMVSYGELARAPPAAVDHQDEHLVSFDRDFRKLLGRARLTLLEA